jgi:hypothetical protein
MNTRSKEYFKRKRAYNGVIHFTDLKSLLKAEFYSSNNILVKRDILKMYHSLSHPGTDFSLAGKDE